MACIPVGRDDVTQIDGIGRKRFIIFVDKLGISDGNTFLPKYSIRCIGREGSDHGTANRFKSLVQIF